MSSRPPIGRGRAFFHGRRPWPALNAPAGAGRRPTMAKKDPYRIYLSEDQIPTSYYNLRADMPT
ncbi:MAG: hypothetical protein Q4G41_02010, partial [Coriobacteriales bacterium]|nr:hypothetical protein [Coriobacteriales bacterium]